MNPNLHLHHLTIPLELIEFARRNKCETALIIFLLLKSQCSGIVNKKNLDLCSLASIIGIKSKKTFKKHFAILLNLNWIGFNKSTRNYFIRSFKQIRRAQKFIKRTAVKFEFKDFSAYRSFFAAAIICNDINKQKYALKKAGIKRLGEVALKYEGALQANRKFLGFPAYSGKSNVGLGKLLNCKKSQANRLKMRAERNEFLATKKRFKFIAELKGYNSNIYKYSDNSHKFLFRRVKKNGQYVIRVWQQTYDEIIPTLGFSRLKRI